MEHEPGDGLPGGLLDRYASSGPGHPRYADARRALGLAPSQNLANSRSDRGMAEFVNDVVYTPAGHVDHSLDHKRSQLSYTSSLKALLQSNADARQRSVSKRSQQLPSRHDSFTVCLGVKTTAEQAEAVKRVVAEDEAAHVELQ